MTFRNITYSPSGKITQDGVLPVDVTFTEENGNSYTVPTTIPAGAQGIRGSRWFIGNGDPTITGFITPSDMVPDDIYLDANTAKIYNYDGSQFTLAGALVSGPKSIANISGSEDYGKYNLNLRYTDNTSQSISIPTGTPTSKLDINLPLDSQFNTLGRLNTGEITRAKLNYGTGMSVYTGMGDTYGTGPIWYYVGLTPYKFSNDPNNPPDIFLQFNYTGQLGYSTKNNGHPDRCYVASPHDPSNESMITFAGFRANQNRRDAPYLMSADGVARSITESAVSGNFGCDRSKGQYPIYSIFLDNDGETIVFAKELANSTPDNPVLEYDKFNTNISKTVQTLLPDLSSYVTQTQLNNTISKIPTSTTPANITGDSIFNTDYNGNPYTTIGGTTYTFATQEELNNVAYSTIPSNMILSGDSNCMYSGYYIRDPNGTPLNLSGFLNGTTKPSNTIFGSEITLKANYNTIVGNNIVVSNEGCTIIGRNTSAGAGAVVVGNGSSANGTNAVAVGRFESTVGINSISIGAGWNGSSATWRQTSGPFVLNKSPDVLVTGGNYSVNLGLGASIFKDFTVSLGCYATSLGANSVALGSGSVASDDNVVSVGSGNGVTYPNSLNIQSYPSNFNKNNVPSPSTRRIVNVAPAVNGNDAVIKNQLFPVGSALQYPKGLPVPAGFILCDGNQKFDTTANPTLASVYPNGTIPDLGQDAVGNTWMVWIMRLV